MNGVCVKTCFQSTERVIKLEKEDKKLKDELLLARKVVVNSRDIPTVEDNNRNERKLGTFREKETIVPKQKAMRSLEQDFTTDTCMEGVVKIDVPDTELLELDQDRDIFSLEGMP
uniref:Uncharacterized protein n=1 Tax=Magallana gigas TaxID=29159 RepID=K1Q8U4_MAGGI